MAKFEGTLPEFKHFIGPMLRNMVQTLTRNYKTSIGRCEHCGTTKSLEAAHVCGRDRNRMITKILDEYYVENLLCIDLQEFENRFKNEHKVLERTILVLCKSCHKKYDASFSVDHIEYGHSNSRKVIQNTSNRVFTNKEIQLRIVACAKYLSSAELDQLCKLDVSRELFNLNFPLFKKAPTNVDENTKSASLKDARGYNRWTWRYQFEKAGYIYAVSTQWYPRNDIYVKRWLDEQYKRDK